MLNLLRGEYGVDCVKQQTSIPFVECIPSMGELRKADLEFSDKFIHILLKKALEPLTEYDYILIDTSPHLGLLSQSAIVASDLVLIPIEICDASIKAYGDVLNTIENANMAGYHPKVYTVLTRVSMRSKKKTQEYKEHLDLEIQTKRFKTSIRETILFKDAFRESKSIFQLSRGKKSTGAEDYRELAKEIMSVSKEKQSPKRKTTVSRKERI